MDKKVMYERKVTLSEQFPEFNLFVVTQSDEVVSSSQLGDHMGAALRELPKGTYIIQIVRLSEDDYRTVRLSPQEMEEMWKVYQTGGTYRTSRKIAAIKYVRDVARLPFLQAKLFVEAHEDFLKEGLDYA